MFTKGASGDPHLFDNKGGGVIFGVYNCDSKSHQLYEYPIIVSQGSLARPGP